jgi:hypothetical protein
MGVIWVGWIWFAVVPALFLYFVRMFAITGFYHRYFSHRTFKTGRIAQFLAGVWGNTAVQRGPLWWAAHHRHHHRHSDTEEDIHSPHQQGFIWSHIGWITCRANFPTRLENVPDLVRFPELRFLDRFDILVPAALASSLYGLGALLESWAPGLETSGEPEVTLTFNESSRFEDRWVYLQSMTDRSVFIEKGAVLHLPVAHAEGRFLARDEAVLERLRAAGQILFRYVDAEGNPCGYPGNPSGSVEGIAGITDPTGRILGMMPHPERHVSRFQHPSWTRCAGSREEGDGMQIFVRAVETARRELV